MHNAPLVDSSREPCLPYEKHPYLIAVTIIIGLFLLLASSSHGQQGVRWHGMIIATKDGAQSLDGSYKIRVDAVDDLSTSNRDGFAATGLMSFTAGNVNGSGTFVESDGENGAFTLTGAYSPSAYGHLMTIYSNTQEHFTLNLSPNGEFLMGTRGENEDGHTRQNGLVAVRSNSQRLFSDSDMAGTWRLISLELLDIESDTEREAEIYYGTIQLGSGLGNMQITQISDDLSTDDDAGPISYILRQNGEADFFALGDPDPMFTIQLSSEAHYAIMSSFESSCQQLTMAVKQNPGKTYSVANLNGTYRWQLFRVRSFSSNTPYAQNGYGTMTFDGAGNFSGSASSIYRSSGQTNSGQFSGTYTVKPNGEITLVITVNGLVPNEVIKGYISADDSTIVMAEAILDQGSDKYGSLRVLIEPQAAVSAGAKWRRLGTSTWYNPGYVESGISVGVHTVEFKEVTGWLKPADAGVSIAENQTTDLTGTYSAQGGTVAVNVYPDNATWTIAGPAGFEGNSQTYSGNRCFFNAPAGVYTWSGQQLPSWDTPSTQTISLQAGGTISFTRSWTQTPPVAMFTATPEQGISPLSVKFTDMSWGTIHTRVWNFGDGSPLGYETNPTHIYQNPGSYQATLTVSGPLASTPPENGTCTLTIVVLFPPPSASFTMNQWRGEGPLQVSFHDASTGPVDKWNWDFGDGTGSSDQHPQHTYDKIGLYNVTLRVGGDGGDSPRPASATVMVYTVLYVSRDDDTCGGKSPCYTGLQTAMDAPDSVKLIRVTQGYYPAVQQSLNQTAIIQGGNSTAFSESPIGRTTIGGLTVTGGMVIPENLNVGNAGVN